MPKVNRFRIVNFKFDDNRKFIADETFEMQGENSLVNLENGGGKSAMLQLALQVMIPNAQLGSRKVSDYFTINSGTLHVLMEWILDTAGKGQQLLLTGFCCRRGSSGLDYFTYTRLYNGYDEHDIVKIPVVNDKREVAGFNEYYKFIQNLSREGSLRVNLFRQNEQKKYRAQLETFNLFEEEFRAILTINQSEGGIEKFFEKARTSRQVVERLIIPSIASGEEDSGDLASSLKKHMDNLRTIPELQSRIKNYDEFCTKADSFLFNVKNYGKTLKMHKDIANNIISLQNLVSYAGKLCDMEFEENRIKLEHKGQNHILLEYMKDSFEFTKRNIEADDKQNIISKKQDIAKELKERLDSSKINLNNALSTNDWLDIAKVKQNLLSKQADFDVISAKKQKDDSEYQMVIATLVQTYKEKISELKNELSILLEKKKEIKAKSDEYIKEKQLLDSDIDDAKQKIYHYTHEIERLGSEHKKLTGLIDGDLSIYYEPQKHVDMLMKNIEENEKEQEEALKQIEIFDKQIETIGTNINRAIALLEKNKSKRDTLDNEIKIIEQKAENLNNKLKNYEIKTNIHNEITILKLKSVIDGERAEYNEMLRKKLTLEKKQLAFLDSDSYIPDYAIKKLSDYLNENDINAVAGSIWISKQPENIRRMLIEKNPYLPYSIITDIKSIDALKHMTKDLVECVDGYPVWILTSGGEAIINAENDEIDNNYVYKLFDNNVYLLQTEVVELSINTKAYVEYKKQVMQQIEDLENGIMQKQEEISAVEKLYSDIQSFMSEFPEKLIQQKKIEFKDVLDEITKTELSLTKLKEELDKARNEINLKRAFIENKKKEHSHISEQKALMEEYIEITAQIKTKENLQLEQKKIKEKLDIKLKQLVKNILENDKAYKAVEDSIKTVDSDAAKISEKQQKISGKTSDEYMNQKLPGSIDELEAKQQALEKDLSDTNIELLLEHIQRLKNDIERLEKYINERGTDNNYLKNIQDYVSQREIDEMKQSINDIDTEYSGINDEIIKIDKEYSSLTGQLSIMKASIEGRYSKEPKIFNSISDEDLQKILDDITASKRAITKLKDKLEKIEYRKRQLEKTINTLYDFVTDNQLDKLNDNDDIETFHAKDGDINKWDITAKSERDIAICFNEAKLEYNKSKDEIVSRRELIDDEYRNLSTNVNWENNSNIRGLVSRIADTDIYNHEIVGKIFENVFKTVTNLKKAAQLQLDNLNKDRKEMILRCVRKARSIYDEVKNVDRFSKIPIGDSKQRVIKIDTPPIHEEMAENMMGKYLDSCIQELTEKRSDQSFDPAKIEDEIRKRMKATCLLDAVAPLNMFRIRVCKPGHDLESSRYIEWEKVISWSGGEKLAGFFAMYIAIVSYLRYKKTQWYESSKVIWIDNPFGQANAGYLLDFIFELARTTNTQMICLTGLQETTIYEKFNIVYSLVHRMLSSSSSVVRSQKVKADTKMDSGMYYVNQEQMNMFE